MKRHVAPTDPACLVIFGVGGDLTRRKLVPALYNLSLDKLLPPGFAVIGVTRREVDEQGLLRRLRDGVERFSRRKLDEARWEELARALTFVRVSESADYDELARLLDRRDRESGGPGNRLFYLATPPSAFDGIVEALGRAGQGHARTGGGWGRLVLEKPVGHDWESAVKLNRCVNGTFAEGDVYRIDHYLGKETVQNLLVFRFANAIFEPLWNQKYVDHVQITVAESLGVEGRGAYFEEAGMTRDMVQNHMFQLVCLTAMEPPVSLMPDAIRDEKVKILQSLRPVALDQVARATVRGQYAAGVVDGQGVVGYREEPGVDPQSRTETYVALRLHIDNWRWAGVPFYLRAGKRLGRRLTEIALQFKDVPHKLFENDTPIANRLRLRMQPDPGIALRFDTKVPGTDPRIRATKMEFNWDTSFKHDSPEAYERLLLDALLGDSTLFIRRDEVEASWAWIDRLQEGWSQEDPDTPLPAYTAGTAGPAEADVLLARDGRTWKRF